MKKVKQLPLTFARLRKTNVKRCNTAFKHRLDGWSLAEWSNAMAGECGETCNLTKKILRGDRSLAKDKEELAKEIADVVCYADLLAAAAGIDLAEAVIQKFNEVSDRRNTKIKL
jgi:NTP pyrophosphatase (non-canonical NTP hydrolase)